MLIELLNLARISPAFVCPKNLEFQYRNLIFGSIPEFDNQVHLTGLRHLVQTLIERHCKETATVYFVHKKPMKMRSYAKVNQIR